MKKLVLDPGRNIAFTSDTHYGHANIVAYCRRPWLDEAERGRLDAGEKPSVSRETLERHDDAIVERTNLVVGADDVLIHVGDVAWGGAALARYAKRLHCKEIYVAVGNHDDEDDLARVFGRDRVAERWGVSVGNRFAVVDHYPGDVWDRSHRGSYHLFGHSHGGRNAPRRVEPRWSLSIDVGVDSHDYRPWTWRELVETLDARRPAWEASEAMRVDKERGGMAPNGPP